MVRDKLELSLRAVYLFASATYTHLPSTHTFKLIFKLYIFHFMFHFNIPFCTCTNDFYARFL